MFVGSGCAVESTAAGLAANQGLVTLTGTGGTGQVSGTGGNFGVYLNSGTSRVSSVSGDITITALGGNDAAADSNFGLEQDGIIESTGMAKVTSRERLSTVPAAASAFTWNRAA